MEQNRIEEDDCRLPESTRAMASLIRDTVLPHLTVSVDPTTGIATSTANVSGIISRDLEAARPRLLEFAEYLQSMSAEDRESLFAAQVAENSLKASDFGGGGYDYTSEVGGGAGGDSGEGVGASAVPSGGHKKSSDAQFDSPSTDFQRHASLFAFRQYTSLGLLQTLLLEKDAKCDDCGGDSPVVIDLCRCPSGDRVCDKCDFKRHQLSPCPRERYILVRCSAGVVLRLLLSNEFVRLPASLSTNIVADDTWIETYGMHVPTR